MRTDPVALTIAPDDDALDAMSIMQRTGVRSLMVTSGDGLIGTISLSDLLRFLDPKLDLEGGDESRPRAESEENTRSKEFLATAESRRMI